MKKILVWALTIMLSVVSCMFSVFATDSDEGAIEKDGIDREIVERELNKLMEERQGSVDNPFTIAAYDLDNAYVVIPMNVYLMISSYRKGVTLEEMASDKKQLIVPVTSEANRHGYVTFECFGKGLSYLGMSMSNNTEKASGPLDMSKLMESVNEKGCDWDDVSIYRNDLYHLYVISVETDNGRYMTATYGGTYKMDGEMEAYKLYSEEKFWEIMYTTYDESAIKPDSDGGGVPLRTTPIDDVTEKAVFNVLAESNDEGINIWPYVIVGVGALLGMLSCAYALFVRNKKR